jgi:hypothetical protein
MLIFDIETGPLPDDQLKLVYEPPELPAAPGAFDESSVKLGNTKKEELVRAKIEDARQKHEKAAAEHDQKCRAISDEHWTKFKSGAALSALTGRVLSIGYYSPDKGKLKVDGDDEAQLLANFWGQFERMLSERRSMVGHNIARFDVPFICRRSWLTGIPVPSGVMNGRYLNNIFVDTYEIWSCGEYPKPKGSLDAIHRALGGQGKPDDVTGADFANLWFTDREKAIEYLANDLRISAEVALKLGVS